MCTLTCDRGLSWLTLTFVIWCLLVIMSYSYNCIVHAILDVFFLCFWETWKVYCTTSVELGKQ